MSAEIVVSKLGDVQIEIAPDAWKLRDTALNNCRPIVGIDNEFTAQVAADAAGDAAKLLRSVEKSRKAVKAPVLELGRKIDMIADQFTVNLQLEVDRIGKLSAAWEEKKRAEAARQAEIRRLERERMRAEIEAKLRAEAAEREQNAEIRRIEEAARKEREEAERKLAAARSAKAKEAQRAAMAEQAERQRVERESLERAAEIQRATAEAVRLERERVAFVESERLARLPAAKIEKTVGVSVRGTWDFELIDIHQLYKANPGLVTMEPRRAEILNIIKSDQREIAGLRIFKTTKVIPK